jgi:hypothetical protein
LPASLSSPFSPSTMISSRPAARLPTHGSPIAIASTTTFGMPSRRPFASSTLGITSAQAVR